MGYFINPVTTSSTTLEFFFIESLPGCYSWDSIRNRTYHFPGCFQRPVNDYPPGKDHISHLGKRKIIFKMPFLGDMLVPWRVVFWKFDHYLCSDFQSTIPSGTIFKMVGLTSRHFSSSHNRGIYSENIFKQIGFGATFP